MEGNGVPVIHGKEERRAGRRRRIWREVDAGGGGSHFNTSLHSGENIETLGAADGAKEDGKGEEVIKAGLKGEKIEKSK